MLAHAQVALRERYALLPYLYTLFRAANETGAPIMRPMFHDFPEQPALHGLEHQFMFGPAILAVPVVDEGAASVDVHFPEQEVFYTQTGRQLERPRGNGVFTYPVTMDTIPWCDPMQAGGPMAATLPVRMCLLLKPCAFLGLPVDSASTVTVSVAQGLLLWGAAPVTLS